MAASVAIGIDLGTTYSCVAAFYNDAVDVFTDVQGTRIVASEVAFTEENVVVGNNARSSVCDPKNLIFDSKRLIGRKFHDKTVQEDIKTHRHEFIVTNIDGEPHFKIQRKSATVFHSPELISSKLIMELKEMAEKSLMKPVTHAVVTIPEYFDISQRQATMDAAKLAGLTVLRLMSEPCAAAMAYMYRNRTSYQTKRTVLIYDLGGGTFDISILRVDGGSLEVVSTSGDTHLGGQDFTHVLQRDIEGKLSDQNVKITDDGKRQLRELCETAKRKFTTTTHQDITFGGKSIRITRAYFDALNMEKFDRTIHLITDALDSAKLLISDIDEIIMTGGSSRITMVQDKVKEFFKGKELNTSINVDEAVAYGAAIQAAILFGDTSKKLSGIVLKDVTPLALGIETGFGDMTTVVKRNTRIPFTISRTFTTRYDYQTAATFSVYEGERAMVKDNNQLGVFQLENIPRALRGVPQLASIFDMDSNGILSVTATETVQGSCGKITLKQDGRLSVVQIDERLLIEKRMKQEDDKVRAAQKARNDLEAYVYQVKRNIASSNVSIKKLNKCTEILDWLKQAALTEKEKYEYKKAELDKLK